MCLGFFTICLLEELLHHFLHPHKAAEPPKASGKIATTSFNDPEHPQVVEKTDADVDADEEEPVETEESVATKSAIRTFFVVSALSFHRCSFLVLFLVT